MTYRGLTSDTYSLVITHVNRSAGPYVENITVDIPRHAGSLPVRVDDRGRLIRVDFALLTDDLEDMRDKVESLADWIRPVIDENNIPQAEELIFGDAPARKWLAYPVGQTPLDEAIKLGRGYIDFFCPSPYAYALSQEVKTVDGENNGTEPTPPIIEVTVTKGAGIADLKVQLDGTDKFLLIDGPFPDATKIIFNKETRLVTVDGTDARVDLHYGSRWFDIPAGDYEIVTTPVTGVDVATIVKFTERWR